MKLKSLLLGSAAALALSTGAQAADPIVSFVSLGVCDAYGLTGLTIESGDTCLRISGSVSYEFEARHNGDEWIPDGGDYNHADGVDWNLRFEAVTQTDGGPARAVIRLADDSNGTNVVIDRAYVQFGDTTVLTAGRQASLFALGFGDLLEFDNDALDDDTPFSRVGTGGEVIQIEALVADGFTVLASLERLQAEGTAGLGVEYSGAGVTAEAGVLVGDIFADGDSPWNVYGRVEADLDPATVWASIILDNDEYWIAALGAEATFDLFALQAEAYFDADDNFGVAAEASFDATETVAVYVGAVYEDGALLNGPASEYFTVYGGVDVDLTETIALNAEVGYEEWTGPDSDQIYGELTLSYTPGGNFESSVGFYANTNDDYRVSFDASKSF